MRTYTYSSRSGAAAAIMMSGDPVTGVQTGHQIRVVQWRGGQGVLVDRPLRGT